MPISHNSSSFKVCFTCLGCCRFWLEQASLARHTIHFSLSDSFKAPIKSGLSKSSQIFADPKPPFYFPIRLSQHLNDSWEHSLVFSGRVQKKKKKTHGTAVQEEDMTGSQNFFILTGVHWEPVSCLWRARWAACRNAHANIDLQLGETDALA